MFELEGILTLVAGLILLFFGRRLFWLAAALVAFLFTWQFLLNFFDESTLILILAAVVGIIFAWLSVRFIRITVYILGVLAGAVTFYFLADLFGLDINIFVLFLIGGIAGLVVISAAFKWGLIILTSWAGASAILIGLRNWLNFEDTLFGTILFFALMILGFGWQASQRRST